MSTITLKIKTFDGQGAHVTPVAKSTATVGSAKHCDIVLSHASVAPEHVRAWCEGGRIWLQDLGGAAGTYLNGIRLPPLKPMLVRELDLIKLGECPVTLGMEPNLVRSPLVKPQSPAQNEITVTDIKPLVEFNANSNHDHERASREVADLKLQVQVLKLEKEAGEDLRRELVLAKEEIERLKAEKRNLNSQFESELAESKLNGLKEIKDQRTHDARKLEQWKSAVYERLTDKLKAVVQSRVKVWNQRPFSKEMAAEWETELRQVFKKVLLNEADQAEVALEVTSPAVPIERRKKKRAQNGEGPWMRIAVGGFVLAVFLGMAWLASFRMNREKSRSLASSRMETAVPSAPRAEANAISAFKKSYTDTVLSNSAYLESEMNRTFRAAWLKDFNKTAVKEWKLDDKAVREIASKELALIQDLNRLRAQPQQMRQREVLFMKDLQAALGKKATPDKFMRLKRASFARNQVYLSRETR